MSKHWILPGPSSPCRVVWWHDEAAKATFRHFSLTQVRGLLEGWLLSRRQILKEIDAELEGQLSLESVQTKIKKGDEPLKARLSVAFESGLLVVLADKDDLRQEQTVTPSGVAPGSVSGLKARKTPPKTVSHAIKIPPGTTSKEEFRHYAETIIFGQVVNKDWKASPAAAKVYENISRHIGTVVEFEVESTEHEQFGSAGDPAVKAERQAGEESYAGLSPSERDSINEEIDRRYYESGGILPGKRIKPGEHGKIAIWNSFKQQVMAEKRKLDALPPEIRKLLLNNNAGSPIKPGDFQHVLRIASKLAELSPAELAEYKSRVAGRAEDWSDFEASVDRFISEHQEREALEKEVLKLETWLYDLKPLYERYRAHLRQQKNNALLAKSHTPMGAGTALGSQSSINKTDAELEADLIKAGFPDGITGFEKLIRAYEASFFKETQVIARVMLDQYTHLRWTQEQQYRNSTVTDALHEQLKQARAELEEADKILREHASGMVLTGQEMLDQAYWAGRREDALARWRREMDALASEHPLIKEDEFPRERLSLASRGEIQQVILGYIADRKKDIATTRRNLQETPQMIYGLDDLINASIQAQNIQKDTIYERIIRDHVDDMHWTEAIDQIILGVIALAAALFTGGTSLAVAGGAVAFGIGAYQALEEFRRYEMKSAAYGAGLISDDPSMAWVIVAVLGASIDAAALVSAWPKLRGALQAFNAGAEADDAAALGKKLAQLEKLSDVEERIRETIVQAAKAEAEARAAWKNVLRPLGLYSYPLEFLGVDFFGRFVQAVYLSTKRGFREFQLFLKTREAMRLIGDAGKLSPEKLAKVKSAYLKALEEVDASVAHAKALGMADDEVLAFMNLRAKTKGMTAEQMVKEMEAWQAIRSSGVPFGFDTAQQFEAFKVVAVKELSKARYPDVEAILQGSAVKGISFKRKIPFGSYSDLDVALAGNSLFEKALKLGYRLKSNPMRIGPLKPKQIRALGLGSMRDELTKAASSRKVNFLLFPDQKAAMQGIAGVTPESILLK
jgi:hypothetical protein